MNLWISIKMKHASIRVRTEEPDYSDLPDNDHDWTYTVYGQVEELLPTNAREPLGNSVTLLHYVDANLMHDISRGDLLQGSYTWLAGHPLNGIPRSWPL
jgi:hypothetical protein